MFITYYLVKELEVVDLMQVDALYIPNPNLRNS